MVGFRLKIDGAIALLDRRPAAYLGMEHPLRDKAPLQERYTPRSALVDSRRPLAACGARPIRQKPHYIVVVGIVVERRDPSRIGRACVRERNEDSQNSRYYRGDKLLMKSRV